MGLVWSIGSAVWLYIFVFGAAMRRQKKTIMLVFIPLLGVYLTLLIATPLATSIRYPYLIFLTVYLSVATAFYKSKEEASTDVLDEKTK